MSESVPGKIADYFSDTDKLTLVMGEAVQNALRRHKLLGESVVVWEDGEVVELSPEEIPLADANGTNGTHATPPAE